MKGVLSDWSRFIALAALLPWLAAPLAAQELEPGAYSVSPVGVNILVLGNSFSTGDLAFDPTGPIDEAEARIDTTVLGYVRTVSLFGRSASLGALVPYTVGHVEGRYLGEHAEVDRSGLRDPQFRLAVNLLGAPAMSLREFAAYRQKTNLGASLVVVAPLGEYDSTKLINLGSNRWSLRPELGLSRAIDKWTLELYAGAWLFTDNTDFFGGRTKEQKPIGSAQLHVLYTFKPRLWAAFDANYYRGGRTTVGGRLNFDLQRNSRIGATLAMPLNRRQSLKFSYGRGAATTVGADFDALSVAFQHLWGGGL